MPRVFYARHTDGSHRLAVAQYRRPFEMRAFVIHAACQQIHRRAAIKLATNRLAGFS